MDSSVNIKPFLVVGLLSVVTFCFHLALGSVDIPILDVLKTLFGGNPEKESWSTIIWSFRMPRGITAIVAGAGLALSGLMMQTLFRNPIAGPFVLGISAGASLGAAILILGAGWLGTMIDINPLNNWNLALFAILGSTAVLLLILAASLRVRDISTLLIVGLMFGSATGAIVTILQYNSDQESLKRFVLWSFGSLSGVTKSELLVLFLAVICGVIWTFGLAKPLNALLIGEDYAKSMGLNVNKSRLQIIGATALLAGSVTAFCGPIAFVGIAVPHFARMLLKTRQHVLLIPFTLLLGVLTMLVCDLIAQMPLSERNLPINAVTSLFGAPLVVWIILKRQKV